MKTGKVRLIRGHASGSLKIVDRKNKLDENKKIIPGEFIEVIHRLGVESFNIEVKPRFKKDGVTQLKDNHGRDKLKKNVIGKPFEVHDVDFVIERHGSILEVV